MERVRGTFVAARLSADTRRHVAKWQVRYIVPAPVSQKELHVSIINSPVAFPAAAVADAHAFKGVVVDGKAMRLQVWHTSDGKSCLVFVFESAPLSELHERMKELGGEHSFDDYTPHLALSYDLGAETKEWERIAATATTPTFDLELQSIYFEARVP